MRQSPKPISLLKFPWKIIVTNEKVAFCLFVLWLACLLPSLSQNCVSSNGFNPWLIVKDIVVMLCDPMLQFLGNLRHFEWRLWWSGCTSPCGKTGKIILFIQVMKLDLWLFSKYKRHNFPTIRQQISTLLVGTTCWKSCSKVRHCLARIAFTHWSAQCLGAFLSNLMTFRIV